MKPTLLILAAGMGSRYGGLKQVDGMGPAGETILEYSIFDALRAGFGKVVFIIRHDIEQEFREKVGKRIESHAEVEYAFQELDTALGWLPNPPARQKPWGTAHAILAAKDHLDVPFAVINADDFYGPAAYQALSSFLIHECSPTLYGMVGYQLENTLSENGSVSRGVCAVDNEGFLSAINERTKIERFPEGIFYFEGEERFELAPKTPVSMNFWGFHPSILPEIEIQFRSFVEANQENPKSEFFIPLIVSQLLETEKIKLKVLNSDAQWIGVTYPEDKPLVQNALTDMTTHNTYPTPLW